MMAPFCSASTPAHKSNASHSAPSKSAANKAASSHHSSGKSISSQSVSHHSTSAKSAHAHAATAPATQQANATAHHSRKGGGLKAVAQRPRTKGQQTIDRQRTLEIQQALIREHYLEGEPSGVWDQATRDALTRIQDENHWQTKIVPDSRALIKLGLGPGHQNLLNPDSAALAAPPLPQQEKPAAGGNN
jgi:hypothetical protein